MKNFYFTAERLCVGYGKKPLIEEIEIALPKGEILTLIGPNGAGKSTVLKSIAGQLRLLGGTVSIGNEPLQEMKSGRLARKMAVVFTEKLKTEMKSCRDVVSSGRYPYTGWFGILSGEDERIVDEVMELVHISDIGGQDFDRISDGQKQRVMLARAVCQEPEIVVLDEPTSYLDVKYKLEFLSILQEMREKKGLTVIMSLHELELAERVSDKILCLNGKYVDQYGAPEEVFKPGYIKRLFGISQGSFDEGSGNLELEPPKGRADIFVIAGGGSGRELYHRLQRKGMAFRTGILYDNDLDYPAARALAAEWIAAPAFEPVADKTLARARLAVDACSQVICARAGIGSLDQANRQLLSYARRSGKFIEMDKIKWQK